MKLFSNYSGLKSGTPGEAVKKVLFSIENDFVDGVVIPVNGGLKIWNNQL